MSRVLLAVVVGAALVAGLDRALPGIWNLQVIPFEVPLGTITPDPPEDSILAQLILLHLLVAVVGGALAALVAPRGHEMTAAAGVAFLGSLAAGYTGVFAPVGPDWYHGLHFATVLIGPCIGGNLLNRSGAESVPAPEPEPEPEPEVAADPEPEPDPEPDPDPDPDAEDDTPALDGPGPLPEPA